MKNANQNQRPLSPFMIGPYYRPQLNSMTSIFTRITGVGLLLGMLLVVWWFVAAAIGPDAFGVVNGVLTSFLGQLIMIVSLAALWYHLLAGLRHLIWDRVIGLEMETADRLSWLIIAATFVLTILTLVLV